MHPATARHIATKLARHFVADDPPAPLVARLEAVFLKTGGNLPAIYRALVEAPESWRMPVAKFKSPWEWTVSALRALSVTDFPGRAQAAVGLFTQMGQPVWRPGSPKGFGDISADWAGPAALMRRVETAGRFARLAANRVDARQLAPAILPGTLGPLTAEQIARAAGHKTISLIAEDTHLDALRLYRAKGYQEVARRPVVKGDWAVEAAEWILFVKGV
jgi:uncharacterized protein (DUF1800 family)